MAVSGLAPIGIGKSTDSLDEAALGMTQEFADIDYGASGGIKTPLSNMKFTARLVKNDSGGALTPGSLVKYKAAGFGKTIGAESGAGEYTHGVVDPYLPSAGVADQSYFWIVIHGPTKVQTTGAASFAEGDFAVTAASGQMAEASTSAAVSEIDFVGQLMEAAAASAGTLVRTYLNPVLSK